MRHKPSRRCVSLLTAAACAVLLPLSAYAAQANSPAAQPTVAATAEEIASLKRHVAQLESEFGLREEVSRLRKDLEERSRPKRPWAEAAPWIALAVVGLGFAIAWLMLNWRERVLGWQKQPDPKALDDLAGRVKALDGQISKLGDKLGEMGSGVTAVNASLTELWKALAINRALGGREPDR